MSVVSVAVIFSHSEDYLFHLVYSFLCCAKSFKFKQIPFVNFYFFTKEARIYNEEKTVSSVSGSGETGQLCVKE